MTLDEQIKLHTEHVEFIERQFKEYKNVPSLEDVVKGSRQYIEWLTELRDRRESDLRPATRFLSNTFGQQLGHVQSEINEIGEVLYKLKYCKTDDNWQQLLNNLADEIYDAQSSLMTLAYVCGLNQQNMIAAGKRKVQANTARGYYNVDLISEGFDVPAMEATILARPTQSLTLYIQQAMRSMRPDKQNPDKTAVIIDHVGNVFRHGMPDEEREWSLEIKKKKTVTREFTLRSCPKCFQVHRPADRCPYCNHKYPQAVRDEMPTQRKGQLIEIEELERKQKRQEVGKARTVAELERIAITRGYSLRWVQKMAVIKGIVKTPIGEVVR